jgi:hypothetical protein
MYTYKNTKMRMAEMLTLHSEVGKTGAGNIHTTWRILVIGKTNNILKTFEGTPHLEQAVLHVQ